MPRNHLRNFTKIERRFTALVKLSRQRSARTPIGRGPRPGFLRLPRRAPRSGNFASTAMRQARSFSAELPEAQATARAQTFAQRLRERRSAMLKAIQRKELSDSVQTRYISDSALAIRVLMS